MPEPLTPSSPLLPGLFMPGMERPYARQSPEAEQEALLRLVEQDPRRARYRWSLSDGSFRWSANAPRLFRVLPGALPATGEEWLARVHEEDRPLLEQVKQTALITGGMFDQSYRLVPEEGTVLSVRQTGMILTGTEGVCVIGFIEPLPDAVPEAPMPLPPADAGYPYGFHDRLEQAIGDATARGEPGTFLLLTLTNLAMVVNGYGHRESEAVVQWVNDLLRDSLPEGALIARLHRDQFGMVLTPCTKEAGEAYEKHLPRLLRECALDAPVPQLHLTCSVVSVDFPGTVCTATDAMDSAYVALKHSLSQNAPAPLRHTPESGRENRRQMGLAHYLRQAVSQSKLRLAFQPVVESATGAVAHYESLLRLVSEDGAISSAGALVPVAERMDLIDIVDLEVLDLVLKELAASPLAHLALNVSNLTLENPEWMKRLEQATVANPEVATRLIVEITETAAQRDLRRAAYFVAAVQALGCQVALDDFGSGYTSFRQLKTLSVDMIKIDGAFIRDVVDNSDNRFFVKTLLEFTHGFGLKAVAEYVETGEAAKMLMELGVDYMQGYYFGRPETHRKWLDEGEYQRS